MSPTRHWERSGCTKPKKKNPHHPYKPNSKEGKDEYYQRSTTPIREAQKNRPKKRKPSRCRYWIQKGGCRKQGKAHNPIKNRKEKTCNCAPFSGKKTTKAKRKRSETGGRTRKKNKKGRRVRSVSRQLRRRGGNVDPKFPAPPPLGLKISVRRKKLKSEPRNVNRRPLQILKSGWSTDEPINRRSSKCCKKLIPSKQNRERDSWIPGEEGKQRFLDDSSWGQQIGGLLKKRETDSGFKGEPKQK